MTTMRHEGKAELVHAGCTDNEISKSCERLPTDNCSRSVFHGRCGERTANANCVTAAEAPLALTTTERHVGEGYHDKSRFYHLLATSECEPTPHRQCVASRPASNSLDCLSDHGVPRLRRHLCSKARLDKGKHGFRPAVTSLSCAKE